MLLALNTVTRKTGVLQRRVHQDCDLHEACLFVAVGRSWMLWHIDFDPATPSVTTVISGWKSWLVCTQTELARELYLNSGRLVDLLKLLEGGGQRLKHSLGDPEDRR